MHIPPPDPLPLNRHRQQPLDPVNLHHLNAPFENASIMLALGAMDPTDLVAQAQAEASLTRQLEQPCCVPPPPTNGGSTSYPKCFRKNQLKKKEAGEPTDVSRASMFCWLKLICWLVQTHKCQAYSAAPNCAQGQGGVGYAQSLMHLTGNILRECMNLRRIQDTKLWGCVWIG